MNLPKLTDALEYDIVSSIIAANSRGVTFRVVDTVTECPVCAGNDPMCATCDGNPTYETYASVDATATVRWKSGEDKIYMPNGQYVEGDCLLVIASSGTMDETLAKARSVRVDNRDCVIDKWYYKGSPRNRVYVVLKEDATVTFNRI